MAEVTELTVDDGYKNIRIRIDGNIVADQDIIDNVTINYGCTDGSAPAFGASFSPHCDVTINSNEIIGDSVLDAIVMGAIFIVECELTTGVYEAMGRFEIGQPVQYTDDYMISFSGEGMLGSVLARKKMNWDLMSGLGDNAKKGILTLNQAIGLVHSQFPNVTIVLPDSQFMPNDYEHMKIVVPLSLNKWKKNVAFKKRFVKLTVRDFIAGIAVMLAGNVVEYGDSIRIVAISEAWNNESVVNNKFFTADSYMADYTTERIPYAPKSLRLKTYVTLPVTTSKKGSSSKTTHGYCYEDDCECGSVYSYLGSTSGINLYDAYVDCQWIGRSFEAFFFNGGVVSTVDSGEYDDDYETLHSNFKYTPLTVEFSGWNDIFEPAHFIKIRTIRKNTATQVETTVDVLAYIADMTFTWNGTVSVLISSSFNGEAGEVTVTIGNNQASSAWNNGTNIPELADVVLPDYPPMVWTRLSNTPFNTYNTLKGVVYQNEIHVLDNYRLSSSSIYRYHYKWNGTNWSEASTIPLPQPTTNIDNNLLSAIVYQNKIHIFSNKDHYEWDGYAWNQSFAKPDRCGGRKAFILNYELYGLFDGTFNDESGNFLLKWNGTQWIKILNLERNLFLSISRAINSPCECNNKVYFVESSTTKLYSFNGTSIAEEESLSSTPTIMTNYKNDLYVMPPMRVMVMNEWVDIDSNYPSGNTERLALDYNDKLYLFTSTTSFYEGEYTQQQ